MRMWLSASIAALLVIGGAITALNYPKSTANPTDAQELSDQGLKEFFANDVEAAIKSYSEALRHDPKHWGAHRGMGIIYYWKRDWEAAAHHFQALRAQSSSDAEIAKWLILSRLRNGETVDPADFRDIDQEKWPGVGVAYLLGADVNLWTRIDAAVEGNKAEAEATMCDVSFVVLSNLLARHPIKNIEMEYTRMGPHRTFLDDIESSIRYCDPTSEEGHVLRQELAHLRLR